jgi:hypothetical protein
MAAKWSFEQFATSIARMDKAELKQQIKTFPGHFRLDFTEDYLNTAPVDRLRHILLAAMINANSRSN